MVWRASKLRPESFNERFDSCRCASAETEKGRAMTFIKGKGRIWPEYFIDCCECDEQQPLAATREPAKAARQQKWRRRSDGKWVCPSCVEDIKEVQQMLRSDH